jgi:osmoprotectant transport system permease protein
MTEGQPFFRVDWVLDNLDQLARRLGEHVLVTVIAVTAGFVISFGLALLIRRYPRIYPPILAVSGILYAIPSIALFVLFIPITGLSLLTAEIALVSYTLVILVRNIVTSLRGVPAEVLEAADGMGYSNAQRLWRVELPIALPIIVAGVRIATVTTIGLVTIATLIGMGGLGYLIVNIGVTRRFPTATITGVLTVVLLSTLVDLLLLALQRRLTPWAQARAQAE